MIRKYPADERFYTNDGPVGKAYFSFSFNNYYDPSNMFFGPMRVLNDDFGSPGGGIGMHPHNNMEIVTLMLLGGGIHRDSEGNEEYIKEGQIQRMTAGTGIWHSEHNASETDWNNLFQMWFEPEEYNLEPSYEIITIDFDKMKNNFSPVVRKGGGENIAHINQDMTIYLSKLDKDKELEFKQDKDRKIFFMVIEGSVELSDITLNKRDSARITEEENITIKAKEDSYLILIDLC